MLVTCVNVLMATIIVDIFQSKIKWSSAIFFSQGKVLQDNNKKWIHLKQKKTIVFVTASGIFIPVVHVNEI